MTYQWGKNVETRHIRIFELLEKATYVNSVRTYPKLTLEEIWDKLNYLYKVNPYLERKEGSIRDLHNDLMSMIRWGSLMRDDKGKYHL